MQIRNYQKQDRQALIDLWQVCDLIRPWNNPDLDINRKAEFQPELFIVGELNGKLIGSAMAGYDGHRGSIYYLAVAPEYRKKGYGRCLMDEVEKRLVSLGCPKLNIAVRSTNQTVIDFYSRLGYTTDDVVILGKRLIVDA